ncbi:MAG TPA: hypothetical protein PK059_02110 [Cyclobacteriaceae bacterium]|nr:hypothetical protein [Cyclobacteriaceae bacterium]
MADTKISAFPAATDLASADIPIVQGGANKKAAATFVWQTKSGGTLTGNNVLNLGGFSLTFQGTTEDIILGTTSTASSTGTQANSLPVHFKSSLWTGAAETKGWFTWRADASASVNLSQTFNLYFSTGSSPGFGSSIFSIDNNGIVTINTSSSFPYIRLGDLTQIGRLAIGSWQGGSGNDFSVKLNNFSVTVFTFNDTAGNTSLVNFNMTDAKNITFGTTTGSKIGTSTSQKIAFWNKTPIVQPTTGITGAAFVVGAGTAVNDASTFGGYTLKQLAAIIINSGLAA